MADNSYARERTGLLLVDPYNDFLSEGGKFWSMVEGIAEKIRLFDNPPPLDHWPWNKVLNLILMCMLSLKQSS
jgi:hypothetical protein